MLSNDDTHTPRSARARSKHRTQLALSEFIDETLCFTANKVVFSILIEKKRTDDDDNTPAGTSTTWSPTLPPLIF